MAPAGAMMYPATIPGMAGPTGMDQHVPSGLQASAARGWIALQLSADTCQHWGLGSCSAPVIIAAASDMQGVMQHQAMQLCRTR
jgi:hypothetical protein